MASIGKRFTYDMLEKALVRRERLYQITRHNLKSVLLAPVTLGCTMVSIYQVPFALILSPTLSISKIFHSHRTCSLPRLWNEVGLKRQTNGGQSMWPILTANEQA